MKKLIYIFAMIALLCSCSKDEGGNPEQGSGTLTLAGGTEVTFAGDATTPQTIHFTAGSAWSASSNAGWCHISPASGTEGNAGITVTVDKNQTQESRKANITITTGKASATVTVSQNIIYVMDFKDNTFVVPCTGDTIKVNFTTNMSYEYAIPEDCNWIKPVTKTKGLENHTLYFLVEANSTYDTRNEEIEFINKADRKSQSITVSQLQKDAIIPADSIYTVEANGQTLEFGISSNVEYELNSEADWIKLVQTNTKALVNKTISVEIAENNGFETRTGVIHIKSAGITQKIEIVQKSWSNRWTVTLMHNEEHFASPQFSGRHLGGVVEWGNGKTEEYKLNTTHTYGNTTRKETVYNLHGTEIYSFEIPAINSIRSIKVVYKEDTNN